MIGIKGSVALIELDGRDVLRRLVSRRAAQSSMPQARRAVFSRSRMLPRMPLGKKMMKTTSSTP
jgi:hypothetical protein